MAYYQTAAYTDTGTKASLGLDQSIAPFNASIGVNLSSTGTYKMQYSFNPLTDSDANSIWFDSVNIPANSSTSLASNFMFPVQKVRLVIGANGGTITFQVLQGLSNN